MHIESHYNLIHHFVSYPDGKMSIFQVGQKIEIVKRLSVRVHVKRNYKLKFDQTHDFVSLAAVILYQNKPTALGSLFCSHDPSEPNYEYSGILMTYDQTKVRTKK